MKWRVDMETRVKEVATEAGHWYDRDGSPRYTVIGKSGAERPTTLRDARKEGYLPSVTTILRAGAAPGLERWKREMLKLSAATLPLVAGESLAEWLDRVQKDADEQGIKARDLGTYIHGQIEKYLLGEDYDDAYTSHVEAAVAAADKWGNGCMWESEKSFAHTLGFGGKVDLHSREGYVLDFKTKDFTSDKLPDIYDDHLMQIAAYRTGLGMELARGAILFVSTKEAGLVHLVEISDEELIRGWEMFSGLLTFWQGKNKYWP